MKIAALIAAGMAGATLMFPASAVLAQAPAAWPNRPVTIVVPFGPGASTDIETRLYAQKLTEIVGQSFVTDYKPGAGTTVGSGYVAKAVPDGYTILAITGSFTASPALYPKLTFDPIKDFAPISLMSRRTTVIVAHPATPYRNLQEYIAFARTNSGRVNVGTTGSGGSPHLNAAWFHGLTNSPVTFIHYKAAAAGQSDLMAGRVDVTFTTALSAIPHLKSGKLKLLAIGNKERSPLLPDAQTAVEQGVAGYDYSSIFGIIAPAAVPQAVINRLSAELGKVAKSPDIIKKLEADGGIVVGSTPAQFREVITSEIARYRKIVGDTGIKLEE